MESKAKQFWANKNLVIAVLAIILAFVLGTLVGGHSGRGGKDFNRGYDRGGYKLMNDGRDGYDKQAPQDRGMMQDGQNVMNTMFEKNAQGSQQAPAPTPSGTQQPQTAVPVTQ